MDWLTMYAARAVWTSVAGGAMVMIAVAYYSTGAPAARHRLYKLASQQIDRINGGAVTRPQVLWAGAAGMLRSLVSMNPLRASDDGRISWARGITRADTEDDKSRQVMHRLLAATTNEVNALSRLQRRERDLIAHVVDEESLLSASSLPQLHDRFRAQERKRRVFVVRHLRGCIDVAIVGPLGVKGLDFIGRGTSLGLLAGVLATYNADSIARVGTTAGVTSLLGAACGSTIFLGYLLRLLPVVAIDAEPGTNCARFRHPYVTAATFVASVPLLIEAMSALGPVLERILS